jgi:hypothetical protein
LAPDLSTALFSAKYPISRILFAWAVTYDWSQKGLPFLESARERQIVDLCQSPEFSLEKLPRAVQNTQ